MGSTLTVLFIYRPSLLFILSVLRDDRPKFWLKSYERKRIQFKFYFHSSHQQFTAFVTTRSFSLRNNHVNRAVEILLKSLAGIYSAYKYLFFSQDLNLNLNSPRLHVRGVIKKFVDCLYKIENP